mmetsp:Transcript_13275/g.31436  ORF Transcript_13275/g.31436 Transcript_13275/m.31436 type:complete len:740 (+) Transcript_13275:102-2321(+)
MTESPYSKGGSCNPRSEQQVPAPLSDSPSGSFEPSLQEGFLTQAVARNSPHNTQENFNETSCFPVQEPSNECFQQDANAVTSVALEPGPASGCSPAFSNGFGQPSGENPSGEETPRVSTLLRVCPFILGNEFCERLAFYGLSTNLVVYLKDIMDFSSSNAAAQVTFFSGTCYLTPLLGAWLADSMLGRYKTILLFSYIYLVGLLLLVTSVVVPGLSPAPHESANALHTTFLFVALYTIALGTGGIKPNVSAFGADQFDENDPKDARDKKSFFNWFYFSINVGSFIASVFIVYVQENISWAIGFLIPAIAMAIAVTFFQCGSSLYCHIKPAESPLSRVYRVVRAAIRNRSRAREDVDQALAGRMFPRYNSPYSSEAPSRFAPVPQALASPTAPQLKRKGSLQWLDKAILEKTDTEGLRQGLLSAAVGQFAPDQVEEVKLVIRMLPVFFTTIFYWAIYEQMSTLFVQQGAAMNRYVFSGRVKVPAASLSTFNTLSIILLVPVYDKVFIPTLRACGLRITMLQRIGWGQLVAVLSMLTAAWVEHRRLQAVAEGRFIDRDGEIADMLVWYQTPQYILIGLSEVFTSIGQLEFFYNQAPDVMRSCSMALQLLSSCIGSYLAGLIVWAAHVLTAGADGEGGWLPKNINQGHLDLYFVALAGIMLCNLALYVAVAINYQYKEVEHEQVFRRVRPEPAEEPQDAEISEVPSSSIAIRGRRADTVKEGPYGRSITYVPVSPNFPAHLR